MVLECPLLGKSFVRRLRRNAATLLLFLDKTFPSLTCFSSREVVTAGMGWAADKFVWVRFPNGRFHPGERCSILVLACPPNRKCCRLLWHAEFPNRHLYSSSLVVLRLAIVPMAPVTGAIVLIKSIFCSVYYRHFCQNSE